MYNYKERENKFSSRFSSKNHRVTYSRIRDIKNGEGFRTSVRVYPDREELTKTCEFGYQAYIKYTACESQKVLSL